jgi:hypothetical protein
MNCLIANNGRHIYRIIIASIDSKGIPPRGTLASFRSWGEKVAENRNLSVTGCVQAMKTGWDLAAGPKFLLRLTHD